MQHKPGCCGKEIGGLIQGTWSAVLGIGTWTPAAAAVVFAEASEELCSVCLIWQPLLSAHGIAERGHAGGCSSRSGLWVEVLVTGNPSCYAREKQLLPGTMQKQRHTFGWLKLRP